MKLIITFLLGLASLAFGQFDSPFSVQVEALHQEIKVSVEVPADHYLYADHFEVSGDGDPLTLKNTIETQTIDDPTTGKPKEVYAASFVAKYPLNGVRAVTVSYWGCNDETCFLPQSKTFQVGDSSAKPVAAVQNEASAQSTVSLDAAVDRFNVKAVGVGYKNTADFLALLDEAEGAGTTKSGFALFIADPVEFVRESGIVLAMVFILVGGLALNLTPCVLPMIPINLAIIGAGAQAGSKRRGFALGAVYGVGIALVYGILGVVVVLTGSQFGTLQSSPWFSLSIALIFTVLALAMFDILHIDLSSLQSKLGSGPQKQGSFLVALSMGSVAALLAGACVAPVVIAVLLLAANLYELHPVAGLSLPFLLGFGMALPWPFAGAGLSFLPKPGQWMVRVKYGFGALILLFAIYYAQLGIRSFGSKATGASVEGSHLVIDGMTHEGLAEALVSAHTAGIPVLIDFGASWCKNCEVMDRTTFKNEDVKARLSSYRFIRYQAENPSNPETKAFMDKFDVRGLPTYVILGE